LTTAVAPASELEELRAEVLRLRASVDQTERVIDSLNEGIWVIGVDERTTFVNNAMCRMLGRPAGDILGRNLFDFVDDSGTHEARQNLSRRRGGISERHPFRLQRPDGVSVWTDMSTAPLYGANGEYAGSIALVSDVTRLREQQSRVWELSALLEAAINQTPAGVLVADGPDARVRLANQEALAILGANIEDLVGQNADARLATWPIFAPDGHQLVSHELPLTRAVREGAVVRGEELIIERRDGHRRVVLANAAPVVSEQGDIAGGIVVFADITDRKRAEQERDQMQVRVQAAQRRESLGTLAGGVAHDFNNVLMAITSKAQEARSTLAADHPGLAPLLAIESSTHVATNLTQQLLTFAGGGTQAVGAHDLSLTLRAMRPLMKASLRNRARLDLELPDSLPLVLADLAQVQQLVLNLLINASEAISDNGRVRLCLWEEGVDADYLAHVSHPLVARPGGYVMLEVLDDGSGMDPATASRIFEPFFTTKAQGHGLGLAATIGMLELHHGFLDLRTAKGAGTRIQVGMPTVATGRLPTPRGRRIDGTVLLVCPFGERQTVLQTELERRGGMVIGADRATIALQLLDLMRDRLAALVIVHSADAPDLALTRDLLQRGPQLPLIAVDLRHDIEMVDPVTNASPAARLAAPSTPAQVADAVATCLDARPGV
jgi:two-component system, cell cycle sensor histidine kinase and response regulator CckA